MTKILFRSSNSFQAEPFLVITLITIRSLVAEIVVMAVIVATMIPYF